MQCAAVDGSAPIIRRVKILGWESKNHRQYLSESVEADQYAEKVINLNHPDGPNKQRQVEDRFGWFEGVVKDGEGIWGDLHYNPEHPYAKQFKWLAENKPSLVGLSHDAVGTGYTKDGVFHVKKVIEVKSVDLVADPATTKGLFENYMEPELPVHDGGEMEAAIGKLVVAIMKDDCPMEEKKAKLLTALKLTDHVGEEEAGEVEEEEEEEEMGGKEEGQADEADADGGEGKETDKAEYTPAKDESGASDDEKKKAEESIQSLARKHRAVKKLLERVDGLEYKLLVREKTELAHKLCEELKLPVHAKSERFLIQLTEAKDEKAMRELIEDRKCASNVQRPVSAGPINGKALDNKSFVQALKG